MRTVNLKYNNKAVSLILRTDADESVFNEVFIERDYKSLEEIIKKAKNPIVDIGAHIGVFCVYTRTLNEGAPLFAYEPETENFKTLKENLKLNHLEKTVIIKNTAVTGKEEIRELYIKQDSHNHSLLNFGENIGETKVQTTTLQKILQKTGSCDLLKMDCEGAEFEILKSMSSEDFKKIKNIYIEYHEYSSDLKSIELKQILEQNGFKTKLTPSHYDRQMGFILAIKNG
ncbi:MAG: FkbM family methyltransferase [Candidatus Gracilibacteria bacterium]|jgi:FkbM family methyltransferase